MGTCTTLGNLENVSLGTLWNCFRQQILPASGQAVAIFEGSLAEKAVLIEAANAILWKEIEFPIN